MVPGIPERLTEFTRNLVHGKPSEEIRRHGRSLLVVQLLQTLLNKPCSLFRRQTGGERHISREHFWIQLFDLYARVIPPALEMTSLVDGARICVSEKQRSEGTSSFVIPQHR